MSCYHPLKGFVIGKTDLGRDKYKVVPYRVNHIEFVSSGEYIIVDTPDLTSRGVYAIRDFTQIPCGKCLGCKIDYSRQWANRIVLELQEHPKEKCYFLTLTYNDEHLNYTLGVDPKTGEVKEYASLNHDQITRFIKRLRKNFPDTKIRYFGCGEYGEKSKRPHAHLIVFNLSLDRSKLKFYKRTPLGDLLYTHPDLDFTWSERINGKREQLGYVIIGEVTWESAAYVARYVTKKIFKDDRELMNVQPEFIIMSRNPGLGTSYLEKHPDVFDYSTINIGTSKGSLSFSLPQFYMRKLRDSDPDKYEIVKNRRKDAAEFNMLAKLAQTDLDYLDYLSVCEYNFIHDKAPKLIREGGDSSTL